MSGEEISILNVLSQLIITNYIYDNIMEMILASELIIHYQH